ncbi:LON peptidase substrate-binding domain-containing protein [Amphritea pacifica]|uniref:LON peptidase substrate-binding domain-containing protein n=1 Tax=Amphritea pacifica TaxID=2811233 RepID=A0ABS2W6M7_9GAMM|nr:LON peptidase substrate-binding domain-containing protein [Amphritea pacifica]MBN0987359.1 LON peptidase substrate-binding domain-containing protein [Amphritea pacifica]
MKTLPLFPLPVVLFPGTLLPLQIFELRYRRMVKECLARQEPLVILQARHPSTPDIDFYTTGTTGSILDWQPLANQMIGIELQGEQRVRVAAIKKESDGLLLGEVEYLCSADPVDLAPQPTRLSEIIAHLAEHPLLSFSPARVSAETADAFSYQLAAMLPFSGADKQRLLELDDPVARLESIYTLLKEY